MSTWTNWSGLVTAHPQQVLTPRDVPEVADAVVAARAAGRTVKMVGTGHSFTAIGAPEGVMLRPEKLTGITRVDREAMTVTALAGTPLHVLNAALEHLGLSLHNMGDIAEQTLAGATSTGTHGTGGTVASLSAQVVGLDLVTADGTVLHADETERPEILAVARLGLGALGIVTSLTFRVEPLFTLEAHEGPMRWDEALGSFDQLVAENDYAEIYWFPHTDHMNVKRNNRTVDPPEPLPPLAGLAGRRVPLQHGLRLGQRRSATAGRRWCRGWPRSPAAPCPSAGSATPRTGCSPRRGGWCSARWSTPCRARPACRRSARCAPSSSGAAGGSASRSRCA